MFAGDKICKLTQLDVHLQLTTNVEFFHAFLFHERDRNRKFFAIVLSIFVIAAIFDAACCCFEKLMHEIYLYVIEKKRQKIEALYIHNSAYL